LTGTPVAGLIVLDPLVQFKPVERDALAADWDLCQMRTDLGVEPVAVHAKVEGRVA
jgi:hypothetical protein